MEPAGTSATSHKELASPPAIREPDLLRSLTALLGVDVGVPDHTTSSRRSPGLALAGSLARAQRTGPVHVVIDATGLKVHGAGEWQVERHGGRGKRKGGKLHPPGHPGPG